MVGSDGGIASDHPRGAGTYPRVLGRFVREKKLFTLEEAIRKMTSLPARRVGLTDRGRIAPGMKADLVLFDPATVIDRSTFEEPRKLSEGIVWVAVNGQAVWESGKTTGARPGRVLDGQGRERRLDSTVHGRLLSSARSRLSASSPPRAALATVEPPAITEPAFDNQVISAYDVHMVAGPFVGSPGESHVCSDWEIRTVYSDELVWSASCVTGALAVHIHLGDGKFTGLLAGHHELNANTPYTLRVRFLGDAAPADRTGAPGRSARSSPPRPPVIQPLVLSDVARIPTPRWQDDGAVPVILPAGSSAVPLEVPGGNTARALPRRARQIRSPTRRRSRRTARCTCTAAPAAPRSRCPASRLVFTDGSGEDREVALPPITLAPGELGRILGRRGRRRLRRPSPCRLAGAAPDFTTQVSAASGSVGDPPARLSHRAASRPSFSCRSTSPSCPTRARAADDRSST